MKKTISVLLVCVLLLGCVFTLASCGKKLSGKYESSLGSGAYYEFSGDEITYSRKSLLGGNVVTTGTYELTEDEEGNSVIVITYGDNEDEDAKSGTFPFSEGEENGVKYIKILGIKYNKVD